MDPIKLRVWLWRLRHPMRYLDAQEAHRGLNALISMKRGAFSGGKRFDWLQYKRQVMHHVVHAWSYLFLRQPDDDLQ